MFCDVWEEFRHKFADTFSRKQARTVSQVTNYLYFFLCKSWQFLSVALGRYMVPSLPCIRYNGICHWMGSQVFASRPQLFKKVDSAIHRINLYPLDSAICFHKDYLIYPLDSDLSGG